MIIGAIEGPTLRNDVHDPLEEGGTPSASTPFLDITKTEPNDIPRINKRGRRDNRNGG